MDVRRKIRPFICLSRNLCIVFMSLHRKKSSETLNRGKVQAGKLKKTASLPAPQQKKNSQLFSNERGGRKNCIFSSSSSLREQFAFCEKFSISYKKQTFLNSYKTVYHETICIVPNGGASRYHSAGHSVLRTRNFVRPGNRSLLHQQPESNAFRRMDEHHLQWRHPGFDFSKPDFQKGRYVVVRALERFAGSRHMGSFKRWEIPRTAACQPQKQTG